MAERTRWEHRVVTLDPATTIAGAEPKKKGILGVIGDVLRGGNDDAAFTAQLAALGREGWELVSVTDTWSTNHEPKPTSYQTGKQAFLKRPLQE